VSVTAARRLIIKLYDSRGKIKAEDENLNKLRTRLATVKSACLAKLPPCEATFKQHVLRASLQTYVWMSCHLTKPLLRVLCSLVGKKDMDHSFLSTFKVKCHLTFYKILFALVKVKQSVQVVVCYLSKGCLAPTFVRAKQVKYVAIRTHKYPEIKA
jgi:hypothetical protein